MAPKLALQGSLKDMTAFKKYSLLETCREFVSKEKEHALAAKAWEKELEAELADEAQEDVPNSPQVNNDDDDDQGQQQAAAEEEDAVEERAPARRSRRTAVQESDTAKVEEPKQDTAKRKKSNSRGGARGRKRGRQRRAQQEDWGVDLDAVGHVGYLSKEEYFAHLEEAL